MIKEIYISWIILIFSFSGDLNCNVQSKEKRKITYKGMIEAIHGPSCGCLQWFVFETEAWRKKDPQRWDNFSAIEYKSNLQYDKTWWVCNINPKFLVYDLDSDGDIDLRDYSLFINK